MDGAPRFRIEIDEVKKRELDGFSGVLAKLLGQYFDELVTQIASGRASRLNKRLNDEIMKRVGLFKEYGVFQKIDYSPSEVILHFDLTRFRSEGIVGHVFAEARPGTIALYRWLHPQDGSHYYTTVPNAPDRPNSVSEGIACHLLDHPVAGTIALYCWRHRRDDLFTVAGRRRKLGSTGLPPLGNRRLYSPRTVARDRAALSVLRPGPPAALLHAAPQCRIREVECATIAMD